MATNLREDLQNQSIKKLSGKGLRIGIVVAEWNEKITNALLVGAKETLLQADVKESDIIISYVPGSFELPAGADYLINYASVDAVICLGCVIQGETKHFDYVCSGAAQGIMQLGLQTGVPVIFGVLTTNTAEQAIERAGGTLGNKGIDAAQAAIQMVRLKQNLQAKA